MPEPPRVGRLAPGVDRPAVLVLSRTYPPVNTTGGPSRSLEALAFALADEAQLWVVTEGRDALGQQSDAVPLDRWFDWGPAQVWCCSTGRTGPRLLRRLAREAGASVVYANSLFDPWFGLAQVPALLRGRRAVVAPRGELAPGALAHRWPRKRAALALARASRVARRVAWQASSDDEAAEIAQRFPGAPVGVAAPLRPVVDAPARPPTDGRSLVFLSRIVPKKNLSGLLGALRYVTPPVHLTVGGPAEDAVEWRRCQAAIAALPAGVTVEVVGEVAADEALSFLAAHDLLVLPTLGESFGHVIAEALLAATPVVVGRDTPWTSGLHGAGWAVDPHDQRAVAAAIDEFLALPAEDRAALGRRARAQAELALSGPAAEAGLAGHRRLLGLVER